MMQKTMRLTILILLCLPWFDFVQAQYNAADFAGSITAADLNMYLTVLAGDAMEGRETGTAGNDEAAAFIAMHLQSFGIPPLQQSRDWYQKVTFTKTDWKEVSLTVNGETYRHLWDFICMKSIRPTSDFSEGTEVFFLGYGIDDKAYSDYTTDMRGKAILIYEGEPKMKNGKYRVTRSKQPSEWSTDLNKKLAVAREKGVKAVFVISNDFQKFAGEMRRFSIGPSITLGKPETGSGPSVAVISGPVAKGIMGQEYNQVIRQRDALLKGKKPKAIQLQTSWSLTAKREDQTTTGYNVLGYIEGSDPRVKHEQVIVTAHFDHLGKRGDDIFNGADDNGSGTSTLLEIAQAFALAKAKGMGPRRSVLVLFVTGEEKGLLGSQYYVEHPVFPLKDAVANVNIDMVGRVDNKHANDPNYIYVIGSDRLSTDLYRITEETNANCCRLTLDYTYNAENDPNRYYYRSDHYNFAERGIPAVFFFSGTHEDYHRPSDTIEKINFERMAVVGKLAFHIVWELANRTERIKVDVGG